jgi:2-polyprenyl-3-methyl-5-hydroxy-6-metoxy-1,4-benzoquinol methylase
MTGMESPHFYQSIAEWYDKIFPFDPNQVEFVRRHVRIPVGAPKILDVGCGTGSLAVALAEAGFDVTGIDAYSEMIRLAKVKAKVQRRPEIRFEVMDMRDVSKRFDAASFDAVLCFGNTLVHLPGQMEIAGFAKQVARLLREGGRFLLQILNYDFVLDNRILQLPTIQNGRNRFERFYQFGDPSGRIRFRTVLTILDTNRVIENETLLFPIRKSELEDALKKAGFRNTYWYGDFTENPLTKTNLPLVAVCRT